MSNHGNGILICSFLKDLNKMQVNECFHPPHHCLLGLDTGVIAISPSFTPPSRPLSKRLSL